MRATRAASCGLLACLVVGARLDAQISDDLVFVPQPHITVNGHATVHDNTGAALAWIGDVNRDGLTDFAVGARDYRSGAGLVSTYSGRDGRLLWWADGLAGPLSDFLGHSVASAGDVNGDGCPDVIVGAPGASPAQQINAGSAFVFAGSDGALLWRFDGIVGFDGYLSGDQLGSSVAGAGDVNQDGHDDLLVAAYNAGSRRRGKVYLFSGADGKKLWETGSNQTHYVGSFVDSVGDLDRDGLSDFLVVAVNESRSETIATVYSARDFSPILWLRPKGGTGEQFTSFFRPFAAIGDVNGDQVPDIIARVYRPGHVFGSIVVLSGQNGEEILRRALTSPAWAASLAAAGDMDLDGVPDLLVGGPTDAHASNPRGVVLALSGRTGAKIMQVEGEYEGDHFGREIAGGANVDGDLFPDFLVGAPRERTEGGGYATVYTTRQALGWYGVGTSGTSGVVPKIETNGEIPSLGSSTFEVQVTGTLGGAPVLIAGSRSRVHMPLDGMMLYGDFLTPGMFSTWTLIASGASGAPGVGVASVSIPVPLDASLLGFSTFWQGFVLDRGSALPIGVSHTRGLGIHVVR